MSKQGVDAAVDEWSTGFWSLYEKWFPDRQGELACAALPSARLSNGEPPFICVKTPGDFTGACETAPSDPMSDGMAMVVNKGVDGVHLPAWAWQTMAMFCEGITRGKSREDRARLIALLTLSLAPVSSETHQDTSWAHAVAYVPYMSHLGPVDIAKVENPNHSFDGLIKVSGFPDKDNLPTVWDYKLPTRAAN